MHRKLRRLLVFLLILVALADLGRIAVHHIYRAPGPLAQSQAVVIPAGGTKAAAATLQTAGVISNPFIFRAAAYATRHQGPIRAGEFPIPAHASLWQTLFILRFGAPVQHHITIPEGLTAHQIAALLNGAKAATGAIALPPEGSILPQTYDYLLNTPREKILARATTALQTALIAAWPDRDPGIPLDSPQGAVVLASIVQEETPIPAELPRIAAVYENRLRLNMRLQADPTVIYALSQGTAAGGLPIGRADLANPSPYNTYVHPGLPPGPICAPGLAAIEAVLHPTQTSNLYFVATGNGGHVFADTYQQQLANIAAYRR